MTAQQPGPRIVPPEEARGWAELIRDPERSWTITQYEFLDLAHTAAVLGEQRDAVLALHRGSHWCTDDSERRYYPADSGACPTARALGVTE